MFHDFLISTHFDRLWSCLVSYSNYITEYCAEMACRVVMLLKMIKEVLRTSKYLCICMIRTRARLRNV